MAHAALLSVFVNIYEVSTLSPIRTHWRQSRIRQLVAINRRLVAKVEPVQLAVDFVESG